MDAWRYFDLIVLITLRGREDRLRSAMATLAQVGVPPDMLRIYFATKHPAGGRVGCFQSHVRVMQECVAMRVPCVQRVLVFEDDIMPTTAFSEGTLSAVLAAAAAATPAWDALFLGFTPAGSSSIATPLSRDGVQRGALRALAELGPSGEVWRACVSDKHKHTSTQACGAVERVPGLLMGHAYALSRPAMERVAVEGEKVLQDLAARGPAAARDLIHYDMWLNPLLPRILRSDPMLFDQRWCLGSDNVSDSLLESAFRKGACALQRAGGLHRVHELMRAPGHRPTSAHMVMATLLLLLLLCLLARRLMFAEHKVC